MELDITVIGIGLIVLILVIDLIMSGLKKKTKSTDIEVITEEKIEEKKGKNIFSYVINRKRNIVSFVALVFILKLLIHYTIYPVLDPAVEKLYQENAQQIKKTISNPKNLLLKLRKEKVEIFVKFNYYIENILLLRLDLFAYSGGGLLVLVFLFNDKIKAR